MSSEPLQTSEVQIGRIGNKITCYNDGSMVLSDRFVPGIRLVDLINGSGAGGLPALTIEVNTSDWVLFSYDPVYQRNFWKVEFLYTDLNMGISGPSDISKLVVNPYVVTNVSPLNLEEAKFEDIQFLSDRIRIVSSSRVHSMFTIKKI